MMKICKKCNKNLSIDMFYKRKSSKDGFYSGCKKCNDIYNKKYIIKYRKSAKSKEYHNKYKQLNSYKNYLIEYHKTDEFKNYQKEYQKKYNRSLERIQYERSDRRKKLKSENYYRKYLTIPEYKLSVLLRVRLFNAIKRNYKKGSAVRDLGCSIEDFKVYIEKQFQPGMTWDNWTRIDLHEKAWNIDHRIPLASFDLTDREQFLQAVHYTNLQPMWAIDNIKKHDKILTSVVS